MTLVGMAVANDPPYRLEFTKAAYKDLRGLPIESAAAILLDISVLKTDRHPPIPTLLKGEDNLYRLRTGDYRSIYEINTTSRLVTVSRVGHCRDVYRPKIA